MRAKSLSVRKNQRKTHRRAKSLSIRKTASNRANTPFKPYNPDIPHYARADKMFGEHSSVRKTASKNSSPDIPHYARADKMFGNSQLLLSNCQFVINQNKSDDEKLEQLRGLLCDYTPTRLFDDNTR